MRKIWRLLTVLISISLLTACVPQRTDNIDVLEYWEGEYYGWYEITDAKGQYSVLSGKREDCNACITLNYMAQLQFIFTDSEDHENYLIGDYGIDDDEHGAVWFTEADLYNYDSVRCDINGTASYGGISDFIVITGVIGEDEDQMHITFYLRPDGMLWDSLKDEDLSVFGNRSYEEILPEGYDAYKEEVIKNQKFNVFKELMIGDYVGTVKFTDGSGTLSAYELDETEFTILVRSNSPYSINYWFETEDNKLILFSEWDEPNETSPVEMTVNFAGHNAIDYQYPSDVSVIISKEGEASTSVKMEGRVGDEENGITVEVSFIIDHAFPYE